MRRFRQQLPQEECVRILDTAYRGFLSVIGDGVICFGRMRIIEDGIEHTFRLRQLGKKYFPDSYDMEDDMRRNAPHAEVLELTVEHMTGKQVREK